MCGIAALLEPASPAWLPSALQRMTRLVAHRGPDGEGFTFFSRAAAPAVVLTEHTPPGVSGQSEVPADSGLGLGHRRLAILDRSTAGHQPMANPDGRTWITFNGEIFNFVELREQLLRTGHRFRTSTDTEVILAAWREWGEACLARFNGMFAFVLVDTDRRVLFAARDHFGIKPLYFWRTPTGGLALASEIKQFTAHPAWRARLDGPAAYDFLAWRTTDHTAGTLFAGVSQLRAGESLCVEFDAPITPAISRWFGLRPTMPSTKPADAVAEFSALLDDAVRIRLRSDVPVGSCLSGGLDSSSIVATCRTVADGAVRTTFTAVSEDPAIDERHHAAAVNAFVGAESHLVAPDAAALVADLGQLVWHQDEPFGTTSMFAQWGVFRRAREKNIVVMLDGQGADEALAGYHGFFGPHFAGLLRAGRLGPLWRETAAARRLHRHSAWLQLQWIARELLQPPSADFFRCLAGRSVRAPEYLNLARLGAEPRFLEPGGLADGDPICARSIALLTQFSLPMLLRFEDRNSMAHSVEARLPFLDPRLVEFCLGLPAEFKLAAGWTKRILRDAMRERLPESIRMRSDKIGFATAEPQWLRGPQREAFRRLALDAIDAADGILTPAARQLVTRNFESRGSYSTVVWRIISFGAWLRRFDVRVA